MVSLNGLWAQIARLEWRDSRRRERVMKDGSESLVEAPKTASLRK